MEVDRIGLPGRLDELFSQEARQRLVRLRRELHQHPELSSEEEETAERLSRELESLGPASVQRVAGTGIVARIAGTDPAAATVAVRGDIDALPIQEETGLPFASIRSGIMHACGHDIHATWATGAALLLRESPARGDVLVVLQPAEETGSGAPAILESGALEGVRAIFGAHVDTRFEVGQVVVESGPMAAAADAFEIELVGQGSHGARPHQSHDPIVGAAALVTALQTMVSRRLDPAKAAVVSVGTLHAGTADNIIPERAHLTGTLRSTDPDTRSFLHEELRHMAAAVAAAHRLRAQVQIRLGTPPIVNPEEAVRWARAAAHDLLGATSTVPLGSLNMGGEDFAFYLERMPGCFLRIGARRPGEEVVGAHTPRFAPAEEALFIGAALLAETARRASATLART